MFKVLLKYYLVILVATYILSLVVISFWNLTNMSSTRYIYIALLMTIIGGLYYNSMLAFLSLSIFLNVIQDIRQNYLYRLASFISLSLLIIVILFFYDISFIIIYPITYFLVQLYIWKKYDLRIRNAD
ncbi:signal transduction histidine kinase [Flavobacterium piscis]|uniref:Signal transduction histidine kinase n=1 Tax=Flavobacterium piscis TaxID=1114874 RepID=A0ABU1YBP6_9FLAO|nr:signal transduction histidine kinase [Flavobacterium piscis]